MAAGAWACLLLVWRLFDKPESRRTPSSGSSGASSSRSRWPALLAAAGARVRAAHRPEPPNPAADDAGWERPARTERRPDRRPREATAVTEVLRDRPGWEGEPPEAPEPPRRPSGGADQSLA